MADTITVGAQLHQQVAEEIRALLARRRMSAVALAKQMAVSQTYVWRRLAGETAFDLKDLEQIARILNVQVFDLFPRETRRTGNATTEFPSIPTGPPRHRPPAHPRSGRPPAGPGRTTRISRGIAA